MIALAENGIQGIGAFSQLFLSIEANRILRKMFLKRKIRDLC